MMQQMTSGDLREFFPLLTGYTIIQTHLTVVRLPDAVDLVRRERGYPLIDGGPILDASDGDGGIKSQVKKGGHLCG